MPINDEIEVKLRIRDREGFERMLRALAPVDRRVVQLNVYLDTDLRHVRRSGVSLRLRVTADSANLTAKRRVGEAAASTWRAQEMVADVDRAAGVEWLRGGEAPAFPGLPELADVAATVAGRPLLVTTWSRTIRHVCDGGNGFTVEMDETLYPDGSLDFEVELEHEDHVRALELLLSVASDAGVPVDPQTDTKHARARARAHGACPIPIPGEDDAPDGA